MPTALHHETWPERFPLPGQLPMAMSEDAAEALRAAVGLHRWAADPSRCPRLVYGRVSGAFSAAEWIDLLGVGWRESFSRGGRLHEVYKDELFPLGLVVEAGWSLTVSALGLAYARDVLGVSHRPAPPAAGIAATLAARR